MKLVIDIPEDVYKRTVFYREFKDLHDCVTTIKALENGTPFDRVLEIIDYYEEQCTKAEGTWLEMARKDILALKGGE